MPLFESMSTFFDSKSGNGNLLYLPLDKLTERSRTDDANTVTVRPPVSVDSDSSSTSDGRQRVER